MCNRLFDLVAYFFVSFFATLINLSLLNAGYWLLKGDVINFENWHCLIAYVITALISYKILFTNNNK